MNYIPSKENVKSREFFNNHRFGIFIHFGIYSMLGNGEWVLENQGLNRDEYSKLAGGFSPANFNAQEWVANIKNAGAKYLCITVRHHDGFSIFRTKYSSYNIVDATPFRRDIIKELADECHKQGIALHFYYSLLDWYRIDYPLGNSGRKNGRIMQEDWDSYYQFMSNQVKELLTNYGPVGAIWFDGWWDHRNDKNFNWQLPELYTMIHGIQPKCLIANNHHQMPYPGEDIQTFEHHLPGEMKAFYSAPGISDKPLESCETMNGSWGYSITDKNFKSSELLIHYLIKAAGVNSNFLLNVGPRPDGCFPDEALQRLRDIGEWLKIYGKTIYETKGGFIPPHNWGVTTQKGDTLYIHILDCQDSTLFLNIKGGRVKKVYKFLGNVPVNYSCPKEGVLLNFGEKPKGLDYVVTLVLNRNK